MTANFLFLLALTVFGIGYAFVHFVPQKSTVPAGLVAGAAGVMGVIALLNLVK